MELHQGTNGIERTARKQVRGKSARQPPSVHKNQIIGTITEENIIRNLKSSLANEQVANVTDPPLPAVSEETALDQARGLLEKNAGLLVKRRKTTVGIITRSDLLRTIE